MCGEVIVGSSHIFFDGENFLVGFTDMCDTPYYETVEKIREIGYKMYEVRANSK